MPLFAGAEDLCVQRHGNIDGAVERTAEQLAALVFDADDRSAERRAASSSCRSAEPLLKYFSRTSSAMTQTRGRTVTLRRGDKPALDDRPCPRSDRNLTVTPMIDTDGISTPFSLRSALPNIWAPTSEQLLQFALRYSYSSQVGFLLRRFARSKASSAIRPENAIRAIMKWFVPRTFEICVDDIGVQPADRSSDDDDRRDADDDADKRQKRTQLVLEDRFDRDPEGVRNKMSKTAAYRHCDLM